MTPTCTATRKCTLSVSLSSKDSRTDRQTRRATLCKSCSYENKRRLHQPAGAGSSRHSHEGLSGERYTGLPIYTFSQMRELSRKWQFDTDGSLSHAQDPAVAFEGAVPMPRHLQRTRRQSDIKSHDATQIKPKSRRVGSDDVDLSLKWKYQA